MGAGLQIYSAPRLVNDKSVPDACCYRQAFGIPGLVSGFPGPGVPGPGTHHVTTPDVTDLVF